MPNKKFSLQKFSLQDSFELVVALFVFAAFATSASLAQGNVVISQIYGGGGNSGAIYENDYVELFNPTAVTQSLAGFSVQYATSTGTSYQVTALPSAILQPGQFFLVQEAAGAAGTVALPSPDATGSINMSSTSGKVALVSSTTALSGTCPATSATVVDYVGFGSAATCFLGSGPTATLSNTTAALRTPVCKNTPSNAADFVPGTPTPRNTSTAFQSCSSVFGIPLSASAMATPASAYTGTETLLTVSVTPATQPASTGIQVTADLSNAGGSNSQPLYDDGTHGDVTAGDNIFSYTLTPHHSGHRHAAGQGLGRPASHRHHFYRSHCSDRAADRQHPFYPVRQTLALRRTDHHYGRYRCGCTCLRLLS